MSVPHGCTDDMVVVESFKEALKQRIGADRYRMWFAHGVSFSIDSQAKVSPPNQSETESAASAAPMAGSVLVRVRGQFALDRLRNHFMRELRGAAMQASGSPMSVEFRLQVPPAAQAQLPLGETDADDDEDLSKEHTSPQSPQASSRRTRRTTRRGKTKSLSHLIADGAGGVRVSKPSTPTVAPQPMELPAFAAEENGGEAHGKSKSVGSGNPTESAGISMTASSFIIGPCNQLAHTAMTMACQQPGTASPLFLCGPTGTGKTHLLSAIADQLRRRHRMRRVMHLSAEEFTNDFISSVGNSGITSFRRRYRDVEALLIDDVQFLGAKKATLRELLYTIETLARDGRPLVFSGLQSPTEIPGLPRELAGRMAAGLVCPIQPLDLATRETILRRWIGGRCPFEVPEATILQINSLIAGDGRVISGLVNQINLLQRMYSRMPTMDEIRRYGGDMLRAAKPVASLSVIETAVCEAFQLPLQMLRGQSKTRAVSEPRMLAMYLSRQLTSSAYAEIARHFGGKSHSTAIAAEKNVKGWLDKGKSIGRGQAAMSTQEAIDRIENLLRTG